MSDLKFYKAMSDVDFYKSVVACLSNNSCINCDCPLRNEPCCISILTVESKKRMAESRLMDIDRYKS